MLLLKKTGTDRELKEKDTTQFCLQRNSTFSNLTLTKLFDYLVSLCNC